MPDDVGGKPFPDGWEPDDDRGGADEDFASVVFDEDFVRAAKIHEPTAVERLLAAAQARADAEAARAGAGGPAADDEVYEDGYGRGYGDAYDLDPDSDCDCDCDDDDHGRGHGYGRGRGHGPYGAHGGALRPYRPSSRWHRPVAWVLAVVMGVGMVALAFTAVYRGSSGGRGDKVPAPAATGVDKPAPSGPSLSPTAPPRAEYRAPGVSAVPRTP
ncbi:hypothetical protein QWM81_11600 [Streptomyces ficellus]|uniref:Uncharacterized protein n=1 Tax=Streptomyces ficellus TaxID=1977088 RepID=A0ABT7Z5A8_9ACTN|nr:hypothetical protein [Streptomyces ficellus]MDN3294688.1 hypothetical protein [Streptomyces ficellus]